MNRVKCCSSLFCGNKLLDQGSTELQELSSQIYTALILFIATQLGPQLAAILKNQTFQMIALNMTCRVDWRAFTHPRSQNIGCASQSKHVMHPAFLCCTNQWFCDLLAQRFFCQRLLRIRVAARRLAIVLWAGERRVLRPRSLSLAFLVSYRR